ncbi:hypothetical protein HanIR_Chr02g0071871 [Helianthus annuus]|nr:hypothetical protein HanIR_Chr02g0071871 [Helianthus annuus]
MRLEPVVFSKVQCGNHVTSSFSVRKICVILLRMCTYCTEDCAWLKTRTDRTGNQITENLILENWTGREHWSVHQSPILKPLE